MKRKLLLGFMLILILITGLASCKNRSSNKFNYKPGSEPVGFRGIEWGTDISTLSGMVSEFSYYEGGQTYTRKNDDLTIGGAKIKKIEYDFWQGKFIEVRVDAEDYTNFVDLKEATFEKFGEGDLNYE